MMLTSKIEASHHWREAQRKEILRLDSAMSHNPISPQPETRLCLPRWQRCSGWGMGCHRTTVWDQHEEQVPGGRPFSRFSAFLRLFIGKKTSDSCVAHQKHRPFLIVFCAKLKKHSWRVFGDVWCLADFICLNTVKEVALLEFFTFTQLLVQRDGFSSLDVCIGVTSAGCSIFFSATTKAKFM